MIFQRLRSSSSFTPNNPPILKELKYCTIDAAINTVLNFIDNDFKTPGFDSHNLTLSIYRVRFPARRPTRRRHSKFPYSCRRFEIEAIQKSTTQPFVVTFGPSRRPNRTPQDRQSLETSLRFSHNSRTNLS